MRQSFAHYRDRILLAGIMIVAALLRIPGFWQPHHYLYDEAYYVPAGLKLMGWPIHTTPTVPAGYDPNLFSAPPLAKEIIGWSIALFGNNSVAWRLPSECAGLLVPLLLYRLAKELFPQSSSIALGAAALGALDGLMISLSRIALLDSLAFPWFLGNAWMLLWIVRHLKDPTWWRPSLIVLWGLSLGAGLACKWNGAQMILFAWILLLWNRHYWKHRPRAQQALLWIAPTFLALLGYLVPYVYAWPRGFLQPGILPQGFLTGVVVLQIRIMQDMWHLTFYHPWSTSTLSMILSARPTVLVNTLTAHHQWIRLWAFSNPLLIWAGVLAFAGQGLRILITLRRIPPGTRWAALTADPWAVLGWWLLCTYGTWFLSQRTKFDYYFVYTMPAVILAVVATSHALWHHWSRMGRAFLVTLLAPIGIASLYLIPLWTGIPTAQTFYHHHWWMAAWNANPKPLTSGASYNAAVPPITPWFVPAPQLVRSSGSPQNPGAAPWWNNHVVSSLPVPAQIIAARFNGPIVDTPTVVGSIVYLDTNAQHVVAWNMATQRILWDITVPNMAMTSPLVTSHLVIVGLGNNGFRRYTPSHGWIRGTGVNGLWALNRQTGATVWIAHTQGEAMPTPVIANHTVYTVTGTGHLDAFALATGHQQWTLALHGFDSMSSPQIIGNQLYAVTTVYHHAFPADPSTVWDVNLSTHQVQWHTILPAVSGLGDNTPALSGSHLIIAGLIHANIRTTPWIDTAAVWDLNRLTGQIQWKTVLGTGQSLTNPDVEEVGNATIVGQTIYLGNPATRTMAALSLSQGQVLWQHLALGSISAPPVWDGHRLWWVTSTGWIVLTTSNGSVLSQWHDPLGTFGPGSPVVGAHSWMVGTLSGWLLWMPFAAP